MKNYVITLILCLSIVELSYSQNIEKIFYKIINSRLGEGEVSSSYLIEKGKPKDFYSPGKAFDSNKKTAWVAGGNNNGLNEFIFFRLRIGRYDNKFPKKGVMVIVNGLGMNKMLFKANNRVKRAILEIYECEYLLGQYNNRLKQKPIYNSSVELNFKDSMEPQEFNITIKNKQVGLTRHPGFVYIGKLIIKDIYKGTKYNDTCISEIYFKREKRKRRSRRRK